MTGEAKREMIRDETAAVFLHLLKLEAEGIEPLYLVDNTEPVTSKGIAYIPCAFKCTLPEQNDDGTSRPCRPAGWKSTTWTGGSPKSPRRPSAFKSP